MPCDELITRPRSPTECVRSRKTEVNEEVHGGRPRPTGAVVPREKKSDISSDDIAQNVTMIN
jgi:hypothetical protein